MKRRIVIAAIWAAMPGARAQDRVLPVEVLAFSAGSFPQGLFDIHSGELPQAESESGLAGWTRGTSVRLLAKLPADFHLLAPGSRVLSFVDDAGNNLAGPRGGARQGISGGTLALSVVETKAGALVTLGSLECPDSAAKKIFGEIEIALTDAAPESAESRPVTARAGAKIFAGPIAVEITKYGRADPGVQASGSQDLPKERGTPNDLEIQFPPSAPDLVVTKVEILNGLNRERVHEITNMASPRGIPGCLISPTVSSLIFRISYLRAKTKIPAFIRFSTGLGIHEE